MPTRSTEDDDNNEKNLKQGDSVLVPKVAVEVKMLSTTGPGLSMSRQHR